MCFGGDLEREHHPLFFYSLGYVRGTKKDVIFLQTVCVCSSHETVLSTRRHPAHAVSFLAFLLFTRYIFCFLLFLPFSISIWASIVCFMLSFSCGYFVCCLLGFGFCCDWFSIYFEVTCILIIIRTYACHPFYFCLRYYDLFQLVYVISSVLFFCLLSLIFRSRVTGACPVTTDCIVDMS